MATEEFLSYNSVSLALLMDGDFRLGVGHAKSLYDVTGWYVIKLPGVKEAGRHRPEVVYSSIQAGYNSWKNTWLRDVHFSTTSAPKWPENMPMVVITAMLSSRLPQLLGSTDGL